MFCTACGRQIIDAARFCNFCGTPVRTINPMSAPTVSEERHIPKDASEFITAPKPETANADASVSIGVSADELSGVFEPKTPETDAVEYSQSEANETYISAENTQSTPAANAYSPIDSNMYPMPNVIPQSGCGASGASFTPQTNGAAIPDTKKQPVHERKYTFGHIMLCLAAVAVMAITAGVFAGLYFSVV